MITCPNCGQRNLNYDRICTDCGTVLNTEQNELDQVKSAAIKPATIKPDAPQQHSAERHPLPKKTEEEILTEKFKFEGISFFIMGALQLFLPSLLSIWGMFLFFVGAANFLNPSPNLYILNGIAIISSGFINWNVAIADPTAQVGRIPLPLFAIAQWGWGFWEFVKFAGWKITHGSSKPAPVEAVNTPRYVNLEVTKKKGELDEEEIAVLNLLSEGLLNPEISKELKMSESTVEAIVMKLFTDFGVETRVDLFKRARKEGFLIEGMPNHDRI